MENIEIYKGAAIDKLPRRFLEKAENLAELVKEFRNVPQNISECFCSCKAQTSF